MVVLTSGQALAKPVVTGDFIAQGGIQVVPAILPDGPTGVPVSIDINGDGIVDLVFSATQEDFDPESGACTGFGTATAFGQNGSLVWACPGFGGSPILTYPPGEPIGPDSDGNCSGAAPMASGAIIDEAEFIVLDGPQTLGVSLAIGDHTHWAWVRVEPGPPICEHTTVLVMSYGYETTPDMPVLAEAPTCHDLNADTLVDSADLNVMLGAFGASPAGDLDGDGFTTSTDLNLLLGSFGGACQALGGCCMPSGVCAELTSSDCAGVGGSFLDNNSPCASVTCPTAGDCCTPNGSPNCEDALCADAVCSMDASCCEVEWDGDCAALAGQICLLCGAPSDCCVPNGMIGCNEPSCASSVCASPTFAYCCQEEWDEACADRAAVLCGPCGGFGTCYVNHAFPGCDDAECQELVCAAEPHCCEVEWDSDCTGAAFEVCGLP